MASLVGEVFMACIWRDKVSENDGGLSIVWPDFLLGIRDGTTEILVLYKGKLYIETNLGSDTDILTQKRGTTKNYL